MALKDKLEAFKQRPEFLRLSPQAQQGAEDKFVLNFGGQRGSFPPGTGLIEGLDIMRRRIGPRARGLDRNIDTFFQETVPSGETISQLPIGATAGGIAGVAAPLPIGPVGREALSGNLAFAGDQLQQEFNRQVGFPAKERFSEESLKQSANLGAESSLFGLAGRGIPAVTRGIQSKLFDVSKNLTDEAKTAIKTLSPSTDLPLRPTEATENSVLDFFDNIAKSSLFGAGIIQKQIRNRETIFRELEEGLLGSLARRRDPALTSKVLLTLLDDNLQTAKLPAIALRRKIEARIRPSRIDPSDEFSEIIPGTGVVVNTTRLRKFITNTPELEEVPQIIKALERFGGSSVAGQGKFGQGQTASQMIELFELRTAFRNAREAFKGRPAVLRQINRAEAIADNTLKDALRAVDPALLDDFLLSNKLFVSAEKQFNPRALRRIVDSLDIDKPGNPDKLAEIVFATNTGTRAVMLRKAMLLEGVTAREGLTAAQIQARRLRGEITLRRVAESGLRNAFAKATPGTGINAGKLQGDALLEVLIGRTGIGTKTLNALVGREATQTAINLAKAISVAQKRPAIGTGNVFIQFTQAGGAIAIGNAIFNIVSGDPALEELTSGPFIGGLAALAGPPMLAKAFTNPRLANQMINGLSAPKMSRRNAASILLKIAAMVGVSPFDASQTPFQ